MDALEQVPEVLLHKTFFLAFSALPDREPLSPPLEQTCFCLLRRCSPEALWLFLCVYKETAWPFLSGICSFLSFSSSDFFLRLIKKSISSSVGLCLTWFWEYLFPKKREVISQIDFAAFVLAHFHLIIFSALCFAFLDQLTASERSWMDSLGQVLGTDLPCSDLQGGGGRWPPPLLVQLANNIIKCWFNPFPWRLSVLETSSLPSVGPPRPGPSVHGAGQDTESPPPADLLAGC